MAVICELTAVGPVSGSFSCRGARVRLRRCREAVVRRELAARCLCLPPACGASAVHPVICSCVEAGGPQFGAAWIAVTCQVYSVCVGSGAAGTGSRRGAQGDGKERPVTARHHARQCSVKRRPVVAHCCSRIDILCRVKFSSYSVMFEGILPPFVRHCWCSGYVGECV